MIDGADPKAPRIEVPAPAATASLDLAIRLMALVAAALGLLALLGWAFDLPLLKSILPGAVMMKFNTAIGLVFSAISLFLLNMEKGPEYQRMAIGAALILMAIAVATGLEYLLNWQLGIDEFFFRDTTLAYNSAPGRMSPFTIIALIGLGVSLLMLLQPTWFGSGLQPFYWIGAAVMALIGTVTLTGYFWNMAELITDRWLPPVPIHAGFAFVLLGIGTWLTGRKIQQGKKRRPDQIWPLEKRVLAGFITSLFLLMIFGGYTYRSGIAFSQSAQLVNHTERVRAAIETLYSTLSNAEATQRSYLITTEQTQYDYYQALLLSLEQQQQALAKLVSDNPEQLRNLAKLDELIATKRTNMQRGIEILRTGGMNALREAVRNRTGIEVTLTIRELIEHIGNVEESLLAKRQQAQASRRNLTLFSLLMTLGFAGFVLLMLYQSVRYEIKARQLSEHKIKALNLALQQRAIEVEATNKELEAFSYSISHDLRAPLRHIQAYVELLAEHLGGQLEEEPRRYLSVISRASSNMGEMIDSLLSFSRMGRIAMRSNPVNLNEMVHEAIAGLESATQGRDIEWALHELPTVQGDETMLQQLLTNLLSNAIKYTGPRKPARIEVGCTGKAHGMAQLYVRDNGVGFEMKYAGKLFGVFHRLHRADEFEGTGIGLANVRRIVQRHQGDIYAEAELDRGACFYFTLPLASATPASTMPEPDMQPQQLNKSSH